MSGLPLPVIPEGFLLIRHGEAGHNVKEIYNTQIGHPAYTIENLTEKGRDQALDTASALKEQGVSGEVAAKFLS